MTIKEIYESLSLRLNSLDSSDYIVRQLMADQLVMPNSQLWSHPESEVAAADVQQLSEKADRALNGEPLGYILGYTDFYDLRFQVDPRVLIPRPESEQLVELTLAHLRNPKPQTPNPIIVDVGTGSGCLALTLAKHLPLSRVYAIDISPEALELAKANARLLSIPNVTFLQGDLLQPLAGALEPNSVDVVITNLPYISDDEFDKLDRNVRDFEPTLALKSGGTPDRLNDELAAQVPRYLKPGGLFAYETTNGRIVIDRAE